jgi:hypothetical protein
MLQRHILKCHKIITLQFIYEQIKKMYIIKCLYKRFLL